MSDGTAHWTRFLHQSVGAVVLFPFDHVTVISNAGTDWTWFWILQVDDPSTPNDEGITALHNAVCAGHAEIVKFLVQFGINANAADSDGW